MTLELLAKSSQAVRISGITAEQLARRLPGWHNTQACRRLLDELVASGMALESDGRYYLSRRAEREFGAALRRMRP